MLATSDSTAAGREDGGTVRPADPAGDDAAAGRGNNTSAPAATIGGPTSRAGRKRRAIAAAAARIFIRDGFAGASVDEIAAAAQVSKPTVYAYFGNKERLFLSMLATILQEALAGMPTPLDAPLGVADDLRRELVEYARRWLTVLLRPQILALRRLVLGEVARFPDLGRVWYESGPGRVDRALAQQFARLAEQGKLRAPDPDLAAQHFGHLVAGPPQTLLLFGARDALGEQEIERYIEAGVAAFLAAYGSPPMAGEQ
jgi:AcrR family transcriptional regulator